MRLFHVPLCIIIMFCFPYVMSNNSVFFDDSDFQEKNVVTAQDNAQEQIKASNDEKNVISDTSDEDEFVKTSENPLDADAFEFTSEPDEAIE